MGLGSPRNVTPGCNRRVKCADVGLDAGFSFAVSVPVAATSNTSPSTSSLRALDWLNVFLADVRDGLGPYLAIYPLATHQWDPASIGIAMSAMGFAGVIAQTPVGALIDKLR